ncbi:MAG: hypothetical protein ACH0QD_06140 [Tepidibacillus sp.]
MMYFHGIDYEYLLYQYPVLSPRLTILRQNKTQQQDRQHLLERFGFEPVHFLESSASYSIQEAIQACSAFGNVIFVYHVLPFPMLQLSEHEVGVPTIDTREANWIFVNHYQLIDKIRPLYPNLPILFCKKQQYSNKIRTIYRWRKYSNSVKIKFNYKNGVVN